MEQGEVSRRGTYVKWKINQINKWVHIHEREVPISMYIYLESHVPAVSAKPVFKCENKKNNFLTSTHT